ncbi:hypothetical protein MYSEV_025 [Mythimna separata entomopoxvirus 'L']|uniref:Uncharacterized protein n=1 Tax=Mythimna separata entomopoxvirus 'L' TaxID=1293572 RepID=A0A916KQ43_9POXV|nr:hypothetical protein MYSEV_025 [Mythimna separata entomopoxvirus 'L']CCU56223.1 hypothetical protein MYSEV_025 [Mythimna separata entomopoxvirus 'L']
MFYLYVYILFFNDLIFTYLISSLILYEISVFNYNNNIKLLKIKIFIFITSLLFFTKYYIFNILLVNFDIYFIYCNDKYANIRLQMYNNV